MSSREIYAVTIQYRKKPLDPGWEEPNEFTESAYTEKTYHAAVWPGWASHPIRRACDLAVRAVVGPPDCWDDRRPFVKNVEHVGTAVLEDDPGEPTP